ncbi:gcn4-complementing protein, putative [Entamoeba invadens IP1]|uniref:Gcn4-complementing protein, putative n=1 Tax=Entamoeba invadens IP1 TaxID=370355 RepID=A0A0A1TYE0_ENTIV|nr:gcn4-complementing protein, putative [Entamoeba invadens IP1]ELP86489.1 gcn4-complementing protein, putative [Entamoeba invadens IP1]|eukprot:XP_004185835.1 gcn4-complementing protein, putative [Entamoeba invadens IP1]
MKLTKQPDRQSFYNFSAPVDIHNPAFQSKIHTTRDYISNLFKTQKTISQTLNKAVTTGVQYLGALQEVFDTFLSFSDITESPQTFSKIFEPQKQNIEIQRRFLCNVIDWKIQMDIDISKQLSQFETLDKNYMKAAKTFDTDFSKLVKSKASQNEKAKISENDIQRETAKFCDEMNVVRWNVGQVIQSNGIQFCRSFEKCYSQCAQTIVPISFSQEMVFKKPSEKLQLFTPPPNCGLVFAKGNLCPNGRNYFFMKGKTLMAVNKKVGEFVVTDVLTSLAKPQLDNHTFELITPASSSLISTVSFDEMMKWITLMDAIKNDAEHYQEIQISPLTGVNPLEVTKMLWAISGNEKCAECGKADPEWVSLTLGVLICLECCGAHRSLGVRVSRVKSLMMDRLEGDSIDVVKNLGNTYINSIYQLQKPGVLVSQNASGSERYTAIREKYIERKFMRKSCNVNVINELTNKNLRGIMTAICVCGVDKVPSGFLVLAAKQEDVSVMTLLLLHGVSVDQQDGDLNTALHIAIIKKNERMTSLLMKYSPNLNIKNKEEKTAVDLANDEGFELGVKMLGHFSRSELSPMIEDIDEKYLSTIVSRSK